MKYYYLTFTNGDRYVSVPVRTRAPYYNLREVRDEAARVMLQEGYLATAEYLYLVNEVRFKNKLEFDCFLANKKVEEK